MIHEIHGDLLKQPVQIIAHQTNCKGVMGAGIAKQIRSLLPPEQYARYVSLCNQNDAAFLMGQTQMLYLPNGQMIANCFGENIPTGKGRDTDYNALMHSLVRVRNFAKKNNMSVGIPGLMGCGLAGGDWNIVRDMIYKLFVPVPEVELTICYYKIQDYLKYNPAKL